jgi:Zn-dependent peptidase ImmA (M78 family)
MSSKTERHTNNHITDVSDKVLICGIEHSIMVKPSIEMPNELGLCHSDVQQIWLNASNTPETNRNVLLHECIHTIDHALCLELSERQVTVLATALINFARDNPEFAQHFFIDQP